MSTRFMAAVVTLASLAVSAAAGSPEPADLGAALVSRGPDLAPPAPGAPPTRLVWIDPAGAAIGVDGAARAEARSLLRKVGAAVSWRRGEAAEVARPGEVRVILLDRGAVGRHGEPVLGATPSRFDGPPFVWVHVPGVRAAMAPGPPGAAAGGDPVLARALAVAIGRVVAHEVVHVLAPSVPHGRGLMSATLTRHQLAAADLPVDPEVVLAVRAALQGEPSLPPPDTEVLAAATDEEETWR